MKMTDLTLPCTIQESKAIKPISRDTVHRICSGQVVLTLAVAMKELVENAVDAGANIIEVHLKEYGSELLEVSDNGYGVEEKNFEALTLKHYTSKLKEFDDLASIGTLGFRGEALSSLCALSDVEICTRHKNADIATKMKYDYSGNIISKEQVAREQGTTVILSNLFSTLPVRKKEFMKNLKKEFAKMCNLLYAYCLLPQGIKYKCTNVTSKGSKSTIVATEGHKTIRENIISVFGIKQLASLVDVNLIFPDDKIQEEYSLKILPGENSDLPFTIDCLISNALHGSGRSSADRQFFYINDRPCEPSKIIKLVNETYRHFNGKQYPFVYLNITTKSCLVDVNITPDKRQVFLEQEKLLLAALKASFLEAFKDFPSTLKMQTLDAFQFEITSNKKGLKRHLTESSIDRPKSILETFGKRSRSDDNHMRIRGNPSILDAFKRVSKDEDISSSQIEADEKLEELVSIACKLSKEDDKIIEVEEAKETIRNVTIDLSQDVALKQEVLLELNIATLREKMEKRLAQKQLDSERQAMVKFHSNIAPESNKNAEEELNKHLSKDNFAQMEIIGQFNLGFIIAKLADDLFIIDQHASDEKYNFELLQQTTTIDSQKLVVPKLLELTASGKSTLIEHLDIFKHNGFDFKISDTDISLTSIPISNKTIFGKNDIDEMIFMLQEDSSQNKMCRPSRIRSMFASRACRKSVMVGQSLSTNDMRKLVDHMGEIDQPWNCPHGRPTIRHLINLDLITNKIQ